MAARPLPALVGVLVIALVATGVTAVVQARSADEAREQRDALEAEVDRLRAEVAELEASLAERADPSGDPTDDPPGDGLDDLPDGLLGDRGPLDLLSQPGAGCLTPAPTDEGPDGLLDGLLSDLLGGDEATTDLEELVARTSEQVADLRELTWDEDVEVAFLDDAATRARLDELTEPDEDDLAELRAEQLLLHALGAIPEDLDLAEVQQELLGDAVAGFYVSETEEVVVRVPASGSPGPADVIALAHELDHALTDQVLGLPDLAAEEFDADRDARQAALSVIEGDASLLMALWTLEHLSFSEQLGMALDPAVAAQQEALDAFPDVMTRELLFPYTVGLDWACETYLEGGWPAVDAAYADPPSTTWEILFGEPATSSEVTVLEAPSPGHRELARTTFGAADLLWQLEAPGGDPGRGLDAPLERARGWAGGEAVIWTGDHPAVGVALRDRGTGAVGLCSTMTAWARAAFPEATSTRVEQTLTTFDGARSAAVRCDGDDVVVGLAEDVSLAITTAR